METASQARLKVPDLGSVPAELRPQLTAMLQPNPADRPQKVAELLRRWPYDSDNKRNLKGYKFGYSKYKTWLVGVSSMAILVVSIFMVAHWYKTSSKSAIIENGPESGRSELSETNQQAGLALGILNIKSSPEAALVLLKDRSFIGITPIKTDLPSGKYTLVFKKKGYKEEESQVEIQPGIELPIRIELQKKDSSNSS
jgi:PEGA domain